MAYDPTKIRGLPLGIDAGTLWIYNSPDAHATVEGAGYFTNGGKIGMRVGDILICRLSTGPGSTTIHSVTVVADPPNSWDKTPGAATISVALFS
jgi:hypothetical protein